MARTIQPYLSGITLACFAMICLFATAYFAYAGVTGPSAARQSAPSDEKKKTPEQAKQVKLPGRKQGVSDESKPDLKNSVSTRSSAKRPLRKGDMVKATKGKSAVKPSSTILSTTPGLPSRFVCDAKAITLEPLWTGKPIVAKWVIKNEGEGNLTIRLKGG